MKYLVLLSGIILVLLGTLGMFLIGPTPSQSILNPFLWLSFNQSLSYLIIGNLALGVYYLTKPGKSTKWVILGLMLITTASTAWFSGPL